MVNKKILAYLLAFIMCFTYVPTLAFADQSAQEEAIVSNAEAEEGIVEEQPEENAEENAEVAEQQATISPLNGKVNLALNKSVQANGHEGSNLTIEKAFDGDATTRWASANGVDQKWIQIDLGQEETITEIIINWERRNATDYKLYISNDTEDFGEPVFVGTEPSQTYKEEIVLSAPVDGRYVKLVIDDFQLADIGGGVDWDTVSIYEFEVYGENTTPVNPVEKVNLALNKPASSSGDEAGSVAAAYAFDGITDRANRRTRWGSNTGINQKWLQVDLEEERVITDFAIDWERRNANDYKIVVSTDGTDWTEVYAQTELPTEFKETIILESPVAARYIKLVIDNFIANSEGIDYPTVSVYEFEVYGEELPENVNLALNKSAWTNGYEAATSFTADKAFDGVISRQSRWASSVGINKKQLQVDLGQEETVQEFIIEWERRNATDYKIITSIDGENWQTVFTKTIAPTTLREKITLPNSIRARYIELDIENFLSNSDGVDWATVSVYEFEVYQRPSKVTSDATAAQVAAEITAPVILATNTKMTMPEVPAGFEIEFIGADFEQIIDRDLTIHKPLVNMEVTMNFRIKKGDEIAETEELKTIVPGLYEGKGENAKPQVIPELKEWYGHNGNFATSASSKIVLDSKDEAKLSPMATEFAADYKDITGNDIQIVTGTSASANDFFFTLVEGEGLKKEGYFMEIADGIKIEAAHEIGAFWSTRTILQILKQTGTTIPKGLVRDYPRDEVRGFMLDVARKPFGLDFVYEVMKNMAWYKMNDFHIHLNDNYIFLERYSNVGENPMDAYSGFRLESDKTSQDGTVKLTSEDLYYTKEQFGNLIDYSKVLGVNIIPEFDMPAHSLPFTRIRPDLKVGSVGRQADHIDVRKPEALPFAKSIFEEYMSGENPVFRQDTIVHIGTDEFTIENDLQNGREAFRSFTDNMIEYVQDTGRQVRLWGALSYAPGTTPVRSENVQMNIWSYGFSIPSDMYKQGYKLINTLDSGGLYIVPDAGYYGDYLNAEYLYNSWKSNNFGGTNIPIGSTQFLGGTFALWNDMVDKSENGLTNIDIYDRIYGPIPALAEKLWGYGKDKTYNQMVALSKITAQAPRTNPYLTEKSETNKALSYDFNSENITDNSGNQNNVLNKVNVETTSGKNGNGLQLKGGESYVETPIMNLGLENPIEFWVKKDATGYAEEQILFESTKDFEVEAIRIKAVQKGTGKFGFSRGVVDYSFDYALPENEWVKIRLSSELKQSTLTVTNAYGETNTFTLNKQITGGFNATLVTPMQRIGSKTNSFKGIIDDLTVYYGENLEEAIAKNDTKVESAYTPATWAAFAEALQNAETVLNNPSATKEEIKAAISALKTASSRLVRQQAAFTISVSKEIQNGIVQVSKNAAVDGDQITITAIPNTGYKLKQNGLRANNILIENGSFKMPETNVVIYAQFELAAENELQGAISLSKTKPQAGDVLTIVKSNINASDLTYQWIRIDSSTGKETVISGATGDSYTVVLADERNKIKAVVTSATKTGALETPVSETIGSIYELPLAGLTAIAGTEHANSGTLGDGPAKFAIDNNPDSWWHTNYAGGTKPTAAQKWISIGLGKLTPVAGIRYLPRPNAGANGNIKKGEIRISDDNGATYKTIKTFDNWVTTGWNEIAFPTVYATHVMIFATDTNNNDHAAASEIRILASSEQVEGSYKVEVDNSIIGGIVTSSTAIAKAGETVNVSTIAAGGYELVQGSLKYNGTAIVGNSFVMPSENVVLTAKFRKLSDPVGTATLTVGEATGKAGETVTVKLNLENNPGISAMVLKLEYDKTKLVPAGYVKHGMFAETGTSFVSNYNEPGKTPAQLDYLTFVWGNHEDISVDGDILSVSFQVKPGTVVGDTPLTVSYKPGGISNETYEDVEITCTPGKVVVEEGGSEILYGDVNQDGEVNTADVVLLLQYLAKWASATNEITANGLLAADTVADNVIDTKDLVKLFQATSNWKNVVLGDSNFTPFE